MSSSDRDYRNIDGGITPLEIWPRHHPKPQYPTRKRRCRWKSLEKNFAVLYGLLQDRPLTTQEWNKLGFPERATPGKWADAYSLTYFEHWLSENYKGLVVYVSTWDDLGEAEKACWQSRGTGHVLTPKTKFICLLWWEYIP